MADPLVMDRCCEARDVTGRTNSNGEVFDSQERTARVSARPMQGTAGTKATDAQAHRAWIGSVPVRRWNPALSSSGRMFGIIVVNG